ncbi:2OG-Fe(II) oxygenase [Kordiimonas pumila]|uniref:2OG-Fe(II) oxygenase n=1 Tax=Kordiimonas pumila TaxID=2161677 RepID=A0ABV7D477_9PROT|nr:2OG-Fe(II) oxygenase [Kordiimonas pumila]
MKRAIIDLNLEPRVYTLDNFMTPKECDHMIALGGTNGMTRAFVSGEKEGVVSQGRTNDLCWINHKADEVTTKLAQRIAGLVGLPLSHAESFQLIRYGINAEYKAHFDAFQPGTEAGDRNMKRGGQRLTTVLGYLNTVKKGGGTEFPKLKIKIAAERGKLLVFHNCYDGTTNRHPNSLHAGCPVIDGEKWAFNLWFREANRNMP